MNTHHLATIAQWDDRYPIERIDLQISDSDTLPPYIFSAGQYCTLQLPPSNSSGSSSTASIEENEAIQVPFSLASAPASLPQLTLFYQATPGHVHTEVMAEIRRTGQAMVGPAAGLVQLPDDTRDLILVAERSGYSQVHSLLTELFAELFTENPQANHAPRNVKVFWETMGEAEAAFAAHCTREFAAQQSLTISLLEHTSAASKTLHCLQQTDNSTEVISTPIEDTHIVVCGSPDWVYAVTDGLPAKPRSLQSDVFAYAPRA